ncbi:MAG: hypothetical protein K6T39_01315, partial [Anoxybacillus ayderensis]|nr:hypothetical protein [Anoxybacillus ayderensis]
ARKLLVDAHFDEVGLVVTGIEDNGFLRFDVHCGADERVLPGCEVTVFGKRRVEGVICCLPPHLTTPAQRKKALKREDLFIDSCLESPTISTCSSCALCRICSAGTMTPKSMIS